MAKGCLILESFEIFLHFQRNVPNHYPEHMLCNWSAEDNYLASFFEDKNTFWDQATFKSFKKDLDHKNLPWNFGYENNMPLAFAISI